MGGKIGRILDTLKVLFSCSFWRGFIEIDMLEESQMMHE